MELLVPILLFAGLGLAAGILLTAASSFFAVEGNPTAERITEALPGANCGGCGFAGCGDYAEAVANGSAAPNLCRPGGAETASKIGEILGTSVEAAAPQVMALHCNGTCNATGKLYDYMGTPTCQAAKLYFGGDGLCSFGCLGFGDCAAVCEEHGICIQNGIAHIIEERCIACGKCAKVCPNGLLSLRPVSNPVTVRCSSAANGKQTKLACKNGCIGCRLCEKKCPQDAIHVVNFHAVIDYERCSGCGSCAEACPVKVIQGTGTPMPTT